MMDQACKPHPYGPDTPFHLFSLTVPAPISAPKTIHGPYRRTSNILSLFHHHEFCPFLPAQTCWNLNFSRKPSLTHLPICHPSRKLLGVILYSGLSAFSIMSILPSVFSDQKQVFYFLGELLLMLFSSLPQFFWLLPFPVGH